MTVLLQISDTHFGTERAVVLQALLALNRALQPAAIVVSGDITQRARRSQFAAARQFFDQLQAPRLLVVPGNHDIPLFDPFARLLHPYANFRRELGNDLELELETPLLLVIGVNTTRAARHTDGEVSQAQIERAANRLRQATREQLRIVVVHQPVLVIRDSDTTNLLHGREAAVGAWAQAGADIVMGGHIHLPYVRSLSERFPALPRRLWAVQAGTAVSHRVRGTVPNSVNVIRHSLDAIDRCAVERWDFAASDGQFQIAEQHLLDLDR